MSFNQPTRLFSWRPGAGTAGNSYWVGFQVTTPSGGTDYEVIKISVIQPGFPNSATVAAESPNLGLANPSHGPFALATPIAPWLSATLRVYDVSGRLVASVVMPASGEILWDGRNRDGSPAPPVHTSTR